MKSTSEKMTSLRRSLPRRRALPRHADRESVAGVARRPTAASVAPNSPPSSDGSMVCERQLASRGCDTARAGEKNVHYAGVGEAPERLARHADREVVAAVAVPISRRQAGAEFGRTARSPPLRDRPESQLAVAKEHVEDDDGTGGFRRYPLRSSPGAPTASACLVAIAVEVARGEGSAEMIERLRGSGNPPALIEKGRGGCGRRRVQQENDFSRGMSRLRRPWPEAIARWVAAGLPSRHSANDAPKRSKSPGTQLIAPAPETKSRLSAAENPSGPPIRMCTAPACGERRVALEILAGHTDDQLVGGRRSNGRCRARCRSDRRPARRRAFRRWLG